MSLEAVAGLASWRVKSPDSVPEAQEIQEAEALGPPWPSKSSYPRVALGTGVGAGPP